MKSWTIPSCLLRGAIAVAVLFLSGCRAPAASSLAGFTKGSAMLRGHVDKIGDAAPQSGRASITGGTLQVQGWAIDPQKSAVGDRVYLRINGQSLLPCEYGVARPDVAAALGNPRLTYSGYRCTVAQGQLRSGTNRLQPVLTTDSEKTYMDGAELHVAVR